ncbi:MAG: M3 family metallopeptidase [Bacteroidales bacterium]|nr:M3 family metallopeptidase [Bacteroidales bacterium]
MKKIIVLAALFMTIVSCGRKNPFAAEYDTPYGVPPFDKIQERDYVPGIEAGIREWMGEIDAIVKSEQEPSFENVIVALDRSGAYMNRVLNVLFNVIESDGNENLQNIVAEVMPKMTGAQDSVYMNTALFEKVKAVYDKRESLGLDAEQSMLLKKTYETFIRGGVALEADKKARVSEINGEMALLSQQFANNILAQNNAFRDKFGISVSEYYETMGKEPDRALRQQIFEAYSTRCNHNDQYDNKDIIMRIMELKIEKTNILGYAAPADYILEDKMAGTSEAVDTFLAEIMKAAVARSREEIAQIQAVMDRDIAAGILPEGSVVEPWDYLYYQSRIKAEKYNFSEDEVRPYFQMENVRAGVFLTASKLYGLNFEKIDNVPVYNPEVETFKVTDADGSLIGIFYTDYYPRASKRGGAWMTNFVNQWTSSDGVNHRPVIVNVGNFTKPSADKPSLLNVDEVETMFHEFGHALHGLLSQCRYFTTSGTNVARDFVELPSQINENWAFKEEVLATYARHYLTGEVIPADLVSKLIESGNFNQGFTTTELCAASILDMNWHTLTSVYVPASSPVASQKVCPYDASLRMIDPILFEQQCCRNMGIPSEIIPRYRSTYFNHIFGSSGYDAGYYSYLWAEVLDKDAFEKFEQDGIFNPETARSFRDNILSKGGSDEPMTLYRRFRGADPDAGALLRARGL